AAQHINPAPADLKRAAQISRDELGRHRRRSIRQLPPGSKAIAAQRRLPTFSTFPQKENAAQD
ncbi:MAG TPA: hypothetical protein VGF73_06565, partial [Chthoniobacterales bacterium]